MIREFEGKTEQEAINNAISQLNLKEGEFDVEIIETGKSLGLFRKGSIKIRVYTDPENASKTQDIEPDATEQKLIEHINRIIELMGYTGKGSLIGRDESNVTIGIESPDSNILIGKHGKNLDAIQLISNVFAGRIGLDKKLTVDVEDYRIRREQSLISNAKKVAAQVKKTKRSKLLEPMNPFERRLVHTALGSYDEIITMSEGEGLLKQIRVVYKDQ